MNRLRARFEASHLGRAVARFTGAEGPVRASAITYSGFLAFFPVLALAFTAAGYLATVVPEAERMVIAATDQIVPGIIGDDAGQISLEAIARASGAVTLVGFVGLLYTGSGFVTALRGGLNAVLGVPKTEQPSFVKAKAKDLLLLAAIGLVLALSITASSLVLSTLPAWTRPFGPLAGVVTSTVLFTVIYRFVPDETGRWPTVLRGAVLAAVAFEALKFVMVQVVGGVAGSPLASLAIAVTVLLWIGYFSRIVLIGAAWTATAERPGGNLT